MRILQGLWPCNFLSNILILSGQNLEKFTHAIVARQQIMIWDKTVPKIKKLKKKDPHLKKMGIFLFNFLIWGRVQPQIVILCHATISCIIFSWFGPLKIKYLKKYTVKTLLGLLTILAFKRVEFWLWNMQFKNFV